MNISSYYNNTLAYDSDALFYAMLNEAGQTPILIVPAVILSLIGMIGIMLNAGIIYTTIKYRKSLNRNANFLIAANALFDLLQLSHPFPFLFISISGTNFIGTFQSFRLLIPAIFGIQCSLICIACTGIDRLFSVLCPIRYIQMNQRQLRIYCGSLTLLCVSFSIFNLIGLWQKCQKEADKPVTGFIGDIGWDSTKDLGHYLFGPIVICFTIACYLAIGFALWMRKKHSPFDDANWLAHHQKLLKSLALIVGVHVGTLLFGSLLLGFSGSCSTILTWYLQNLSIMAVLIGASSNAVVLYLNSSEYRNLFQNALMDLKKMAQNGLKFGPNTVRISPMIIESKKEQQKQQSSSQTPPL